MTLLIRIEHLPNGDYAAIDDANNDLGWPMGDGKTLPRPSPISPSRCRSEGCSTSNPPERKGEAHAHKRTT
jgi:hypothetical protein